jgi:hypothetical protein
MQDAAPAGEAFAKDLQHVGARVAVVDDDGQVQAPGQVELPDEELHLRVPVAELAVVVEADLTDGHHAFQLRSLGDARLPVLAGLDD